MNLTADSALYQWLAEPWGRLFEPDRHRYGPRTCTFIFALCLSFVHHFPPYAYQEVLSLSLANFLVNRRMSKSQQMRWSRRGADLVLQVRCAVYNGTLGSGFGQRFEPTGRPEAADTIAA
jgi:hypothetical protein